MHREPSSIRGLNFFGQWKSGKKLHRLPRHKNPGLEIVFVSKGELRWEVEGRALTVGADTLFYTLPWQVHGGVEEVQPSSEISYVCIELAGDCSRPRSRFGFHPAFGFSAGEEKVVSGALTRSRVQAVPASGPVAGLFAYFFAVAEERAPLRESCTREIIKLLIFELAGCTETHARPGTAQEAERRVRNFVRVLAARFTEPWTLATMSEACRLGRTQFAQILKKQVGDTPVTHLNRLRIGAAQKLIRESDKSITEIALEVGFNSSQYFATVFKEFIDMDARTFRTRQGRHLPGGR